MNSIFEEEETLISRRPMLSKMLSPVPIELNPSINIGSITTDLTYRLGPGKEKRSKLEAASRVQPALAYINKVGRIPFFRPYVLGLNVLTYGLILVDPLDRLE